MSIESELAAKILADKPASFWLWVDEERSIELAHIYISRKLLICYQLSNT